ncbi:ribosomal N-lysine methyltransferase [Aspergillus stella-maris]|uniref:ribosomal N-lysine methyltransferase n=1 Tax=Aspergillus stella-maris TaxID=1810926 RepID=UPI003CCD3763
MAESAGPEHTAFTQWAVKNGIKINGVAPAHFPGRRLGMVATRDVDENETMLSIPVDLMLTIDSIPKAFLSCFPESTPVQGILAAFLTHGDQKALSKMSTWQSVWPPWSEFEESMPIFWTGTFRVSQLPGDDRQNETHNGKTTPKMAFARLPPSISGSWNTNSTSTSNTNSNSTSKARTSSTSPSPSSDSDLTSYEKRYQSLLPQQESRFERAWSSTLSVFPSTDFTKYAHNWAIINSRSFYYISPGKEEPEDWNDAIAMVPYADYFNHADDAACEVVFDGEWYTFKATRRYEKGEEIYMNYGEHSNDFLWVEYGFSLPNNPSDSIYLDEIIIPELSQAEKKELIEQACFGNYELTASGVNNSVIAAASIKYMNRQQWRDYVNDGSGMGFDGEKTASVIRGWVEAYLKECKAALDALRGLSKGAITCSDKEKLGLILARWRQIQQLCEAAINDTAI